MVHRRELDGETLVFGNHGALWGNAMTWWDHDTGSIWSQPLGEAIVGPRKGAVLDPFPVSFMTWDAWRKTYPETLALDAPGGNSGFNLDDMYIVVDLGGEAAAYPVSDLRTGGVVNDVVAGLEIAVVVDPGDSRRWAVFSRRLDGEVVTLSVRGQALVDERTGTAWDPVRGLAREGSLAGEVLALLPGITSFPGDFDTFWPEGRVWQP